MWDWELLKNRTSNGHSEILAQFGNEDFRYTHAVSHGSSEDEYCLHNHAMYELVYCVGGEAVFLADGVRYQMRPGSLLIITPTVPHKLFLREETPFERHILYVYSTGNASELSRLMGEGRLADQSMGSAYYEDVQRVDADFDRISETSRSSDETIRGLTPLFVRAFAADLLITMRQRDPLRFSVGVSRKIDSILLYLNQHFTADLTLQ
ncbi:MAG: cupin domain-containing protein, partial [Eubacteriales bacterium]|nr:cupin domain-containing protein [Eubacteriales bacterium]